MRQPCNNCPWRRDAPPALWHADHFTSIWRNCQDDGQSIMLCHKATALPEEERGGERGGLVCQGWVRVVGVNAVGVRIAMMRGKVTDDELADRERPDLFASFEEMLRANGVQPPPRNRWRR